MTEYEKLVQYAYNILSTVHKKYLEGNSMAYPMLLVGMGNLRVESIPNSGHNYQAISDAIHLRYKEDSKYQDGYELGLQNIIGKVMDIQTAQLVFNYLHYEIKKQKDGHYSFKMLLKPLITYYIKILKDNQDIITEQSEDWQRYITEILDVLNNYE